MPTLLVRYGAVPEVARFQSEQPFPRKADVVVRTHRGQELGQVLDLPRREPGVPVQESADGFQVLREATEADRSSHIEMKQRVTAEFAQWEQRIAEWNLDLQLIELEWTLDGEKLVLYVLNERGPECTKLAIQAAAAGLGIIEVQPVSLEGPVTVPTGAGGCGSCGHH